MKWSEPKRVTTSRGETMLRTATPTETFWSQWRTNKQALKDAGISCGTNKKTGEWEVLWWQPLDPEIAKREATQKAALVEASRAQDCTIEIPAPEGRAYLPYQKAGIRFCRDLYATGKTGALIADEMGLGKTIQAIGLINLDSSIKRVLVICPATLKVNWSRELSKWLTRPLKVGIQNAGETWLGDLVDVLIINYDILSRYADKLNAGNWDLKVSDEAHYAKNPKAARSKALFGIPAKRKLALTGTPILNRPVELFPILKDLDKSAWGNWLRYVERYCAAVRTGYGWDVSGASNLDELQTKLRGSVMVRRLKKDVLTELPAKRRQVVELDATGCDEVIDAEKQIFETRRETLDLLRARVELAKASEDRAEYEGAVEALREGQGALFAEMAKLRHETVLKKLPQVIGYVEDALDGNGKLIAFGHHLDGIAQLKAKFPGAAVVTGGMSSEEKMAEVDRFQNDPACKLFIGNDAAKEGLTLTASSHVVFFELDWVPGNLSQKEDRAHRIGQKDSVLVTHLVLEGSLDAVMAKRLIEKQEVIDAALDTGAEDFELKVEFAKGPAATSVELQEPKPTTDKQGKPQAPASFDKLAEEGAKLDRATIDRAHQGMKLLAGCDADHAMEINGVGFSKFDGQIGHSLAMAASLTPKQGALAVRLCRKYRKQLGEHFLD